MKKITYTKDELERAVASCSSVRAVCRLLGVTGGGAHQFVKDKIDFYKFDTSHFTGQIWNKGKEVKSISELTTKRARKERLIKLRGQQCESCGLTHWLSKAINLEVHHKDGLNNNQLNNLVLLCPNCHSYTDNWRGRKNLRTCGGMADTQH